MKKKLKCECGKEIYASGMCADCYIKKLEKRIKKLEKINRKIEINVNCNHDDYLYNGGWIG